MRQICDKNVNETTIMRKFEIPEALRNKRIDDENYIATYDATTAKIETA